MTRTAILAGIGRPEDREIGIRAQIYLAKSLLINSLIKGLTALLQFLDSFSFFSGMTAGVSS